MHASDYEDLPGEDQITLTEVRVSHSDIVSAITTPPPGSRGTIDIDLALGVRRLANDLGEKEAARRLDISRTTLVRVCSALPIQGMSADVLRRRLDAIRERITAVDTMNGALAPRGLAVDTNALANAADGQVSR